MHGYFVDIRLYRKAKSVAEPFAYEEYRRKKIREKIESERTSRVQVQVKYICIHNYSYFFIFVGPLIKCIYILYDNMNFN